MCAGCWEEEGAPQIDNAAVRLAAQAIARVYAHDDGLCGACLHVVVDDWNVEDSNLAFCAAEIAKPDADHEHDDPSIIPIERACLEALQALTPDERVSALALHYGLFKAAE